MTLRDLQLRIRALFARRGVERELDEEIAFHLERETEKLVASGMSRPDAMSGHARDSAPRRSRPKNAATRGERR